MAGKTEQALAVFDGRSAKIDPAQETRRDALSCKAELLLKQGRYDEAWECIGEADDGEERDFIRMSCHFRREEYEKADEYVEWLKQSSNPYHVYFATYADAHMAKKLPPKGEDKTETAEWKYHCAVAYFKNRMFVNPHDVQAVLYRLRLYIENDEFYKATAMWDELPGTLQAEQKQDVLECRSRKKPIDGAAAGRLTGAETPMDS